MAAKTTGKVRAAKVEAIQTALKAIGPNATTVEIQEHPAYAKHARKFGRVSGMQLRSIKDTSEAVEYLGTLPANGKTARGKATGKSKLANARGNAIMAARMTRKAARRSKLDYIRGNGSTSHNAEALDVVQKLAAVVKLANIKPEDLPALLSILSE